MLASSGGRGTETTATAEENLGERFSGGITVHAPPGGRHSSLMEAVLSLYLKNSTLSG
jgi:hypothetical protein